MKKIRPLKSDPRYTITLEQCGQEKPFYSVRFCDGELLGGSAHYSSAVMLAAGDASRRRGCSVIQAVEESS